MRRELSLVAVGASAGGLDALIGFFKEVPPACEAAFLVIQHLSPDHESIMAELLAPHARLPVQTASDGMGLDSGIIYLCPPGVIPRVNGLKLQLEKRPRDQSVVLPINILFESMARTLGSSAVAVILSGTGSDGSQGIRRVRQSGGLVAVQSPETAQFTGMPQCAISTGCVDIIESTEALWAKIENFAREKRAHPSAREAELSDSQESPPFAADAYQEVFKLLEDRFGLDFSVYRINSVSRRLLRRIQLLAIPDLAGYLQYLEGDDSEAECLYQDLLIGVTEFFRDKESFGSLSREAMKAVMTAERSEDFRIWSAGCATGQEAYSLYIMADEARRETGFTGRITVFATDVFKPSIEFAGNGVYDSKLLSGMGEARRARYFQKFDSRHFKVQPHVRENIIFAQHDFLTDAPFTNMDLVSCRNVLIYLKPETQERALGAFAYALRDKGILFLGASESLGKLESSFQTVSSKAKIFRKHSSQLDANRWPRKKIVHVAKTRHGHGVAAGSSVTINRDLLSAYDSLLERFAPCGFLVNLEREVLHYFGDAGSFCINVTGRVRLDLTDQLDKPLHLAVASLMHQVVRTGKRASSSGVRCRSRDGERVVDVAVEPVADLHGDVRSYLIEIKDRKVDPIVVSEDSSVHPEESDLQIDTVGAANQIGFLERELKFTRESLEAANEELQVSNEELQAVNEELQVSNEELQSSNEEMHSLNEELSTLNAEYARKNEELVRVNASHENLLESTEDGVLYVDRELRIRQFNDAIRSAFSLMPSDVGRPLRDIAYWMEDEISMLDDVNSVMETGNRVERETDIIDGRIFMKRIVPFRGSDGEIDGALLTFTDVTESRDQKKRFEFALRSAGLSWWDWDIVKGEIVVSSGGACLLGDDCLSTQRDYDGWMREVHPDDRDEVKRSLDACLKGETEEWNCEHRFRTTQGGWLWVMNQGVVTRRAKNGSPMEMMGSSRDIDFYRRAMTDLAGQLKTLEAAGEMATFGTWEYDVETDSMLWSEMTRRILEVDVEVESSVEAFYAMMARDEMTRVKDAFERLLKEGRPYDLTLKITTAKGRPIVGRSAGKMLYDRRGDPVRVIGVFQDVTEVTKIEHEMSAFFTLTPDFQATVDFEGRFQSFNSSWAAELGYGAAELHRMCLCQLVGAGEREAFKALLREVIEGDTVTSYETTVVPTGNQAAKWEGRQRWMSWSLSSDQDLKLVFVSARCVTLQKETQHSLEEARIRAEEANRAKTDFLAVMSHELRTPLNPIMGYADLLSAEVQNVEQREILGIMVESCEHMVSLIDEILDYSRLDAGKTKVELVEFSLDEFLKRKVALMSGQLKDRPISLNFSIDWGPLDRAKAPVFLGDTGMIRQVARNLISNAIKFTREGRVDFDVRVVEASRKQATVTFFIRDTGIGIPKEDQGKLFKPFSQVETGMARSYGGTGLGLAICKRLVDLMGGEIGVDSARGAGATFSFTLSFAYRYTAGVALTDGDAQDPSAPTGSLESRPKLSGDVLVVEDSETNASYVLRLIHSRGARAECVPDGESALESLPNRTFDLMLLDLHMPGIGGLETLKRIRTREKEHGQPPLPIFAVTADASKESEEACAGYGATGFLVKPIAPSDLHALLDDFLKPG